MACRAATKETHSCLLWAFLWMVLHVCPITFISACTVLRQVYIFWPTPFSQESSGALFNLVLSTPIFVLVASTQLSTQLSTPITRASCDSGSPSQPVAVGTFCCCFRNIFFIGFLALCATPNLEDQGIAFCLDSTL